jgi:hypothetical protein
MYSEWEEGRTKSGLTFFPLPFENPIFRLVDSCSAAGANGLSGLFAVAISIGVTLAAVCTRSMF